MGKLDGKVAIVTGGSQGIGAAYCKKLAEEGAKVVVADVVDGSNVVGVIEQAGGEAIFVEPDVASEGGNKNMVAEAVKAFGRLDILVANAGLYTHLDRKPSTEETTDEWDQVYVLFKLFANFMKQYITQFVPIYTNFWRISLQIVLI